MIIARFAIWAYLCFRMIGNFFVYCTHLLVKIMIRLVDRLDICLQNPTSDQIVFNVVQIFGVLVA